MFEAFEKPGCIQQMQSDYSTDIEFPKYPKCVKCKTNTRIPWQLVRYGLTEQWVGSAFCESCLPKIT